MNALYLDPFSIAPVVPTEAARDVVALMNRFGSERRPFIFIIDFLMQQPVAIPLDEVNPDSILFDFDGTTNAGFSKYESGRPFVFEKEPVSYSDYQKAFDFVTKHLQFGNSYLLNLTQPTQVRTNLSLEEIFYRSRAQYKLFWRDRFVVFSPELFVLIENGRIESHPMKGTIDASQHDAESRLLSDRKELAEHHTIVDLIRNDMNRVAVNVKLERFRFITKVKTHQKELLQVSSSITGELKGDYLSYLGNILFCMLPAGSVSGAPKKKTIEIILEAENYERGYYTGVCGIFDGQRLNSGVMIRFIEHKKNQLWFKSGGGITVNSNCSNEYQELIDKVYVPFI